MDLDRAHELLRTHHRAVLVTFRSDGRPQTSPVLCGLDEAGRVVVSTREATAKARNVRRDPRVSLCVLGDQFFGDDWVQVDGRAEVVPLPDAMDGLVELYRTVAGEHPDWDEFRSAMEEQRRVLLRVTVERVGPDRGA